jgi:hypothetical protein
MADIPVPLQQHPPDVQDFDDDHNIGLPGGIDGAQLEDGFTGPFLLIFLFKLKAK